jgi:phage shock protein A
MFSRIGRLVRGFFSLFITGLEEANPEALMAAARDDFRSKMVQYNLALARMAGVAERLKGQVKSKAAKATDLERRVLANHSAGNLELAGSLARELQEGARRQGSRRHGHRRREGERAQGARTERAG